MLAKRYEIGTLINCCGNAKRCSNCGKQFVSFSKLRVGLPYNMAILLLCVHPAEPETGSHKTMHINVSRNIIHNNVEMTQFSSTDEMKNKMVYLY